MTRYKIHRQLVLSMLLLTQSYLAYAAALTTQIQNISTILNALKVPVSVKQAAPGTYNSTGPKVGFGPKAIITPGANGQYNVSQLSASNSVNDLYEIFGANANLTFVTHCAPSTTTTFAGVGPISVAVSTNGVLSLDAPASGSVQGVSVDTLFPSLNLENGVAVLLLAADSSGNILTTTTPKGQQAQFSPSQPSQFYLVAWDMESMMLLGAPVQVTQKQFQSPVVSPTNSINYAWTNPWTTSVAYDIANVDGTINGTYPFALQVIAALPDVAVTESNGSPIGFVGSSNNKLNTLNINLVFGVNNQGVSVSLTPEDIETINHQVINGNSVELEYNVIQRGDNSCFDLIYTLYEYDALTSTATNVIGGARVNGLADNGNAIIPVSAVGSTVAWDQTNISYTTTLDGTVQPEITLPSVEASPVGPESASGQITYQTIGWLINGSDVGNYNNLKSSPKFSVRQLNELTLSCNQIPPTMLFFNVVNQGLAFYGGWNTYVTQHALAGSLLPSNINWNSGVIMVVLAFDAQNNLLADLSTLGTAGPAKVCLYCYDYVTGDLLAGSPLNVTENLITDMHTALAGTKQYIEASEINKWDNNCMGAAANIGDWSGYDYKNQKENQYPLAVIIQASADATRTVPTLTSAQINAGINTGPLNNPQLSTMSNLMALFGSIPDCQLTQVSSNQNPSGYAYINLGANTGFSGGGVAINVAPNNLPNSPVLSLAPLGLTQTNWDNGVQLVLLAFDSNNHLVAGISSQPASLYLYAYDLPTGALLGAPIQVGIGTQFVKPGAPGVMPTCWNNKMGGNAVMDTDNQYGTYPMILTVQTKLGTLPKAPTSNSANPAPSVASLTTYQVLQNAIKNLGGNLSVVQTSSAGVSTNPTFMNMNITGVGGIMWYENQWGTAGNASKFPVAPDVSAATSGKWTAPGLTWVLLAVDGSGNIITDLTKTTPVGFALNIYSVSTGQLLSSTAVPLNAITYNYSAAVTSASNATWQNSMSFGGSSPSNQAWPALAASYPVAWTISN